VSAMADECILKVENIRKAFGKRQVLKVSPLPSARESSRFSWALPGREEHPLQCINFLVIPDEGRCGSRVAVSPCAEAHLYAYRSRWNDLSGF